MSNEENKKTQESPQKQESKHKRDIINSMIAVVFLIIAIVGAVVLSLVWKDYTDINLHICVIVCATVISCCALVCATVALGIIVKGYCKEKAKDTNDDNSSKKILLEAYNAVFNNTQSEPNNISNGTEK